MNNKRLYYIDILNCIAIVFVLFLHSTQLAHAGNSNFSHFRLALVVQSICIPAVYIFFMNSGATLLDYRKKYSTKTFLKKRIHRVLIPFVIWSAIYYLYDVKHIAYPGTMAHNQPGLKDFIKAFLNNNINYLFWFFYAIIALYIFTPIISPLIKNHKDILFYIVIVFFICSDVLNYISKLTKINFSTSFINQPLISSCYLGYFVIGYLIKINYFNNKQIKFFIIIGLTSLILNLINDLFYGRIIFLSNIGPFLYSIGLYIFIKQVTEKYINQYKILRLFTLLSSTSLGVYILHPFIYEVLDKYVYGATANDWNLFIKLMNRPMYMLSLPLISYIILIFIVIIIKKIKFMRIFIP